MMKRWRAASAVRMSRRAFAMDFSDRQTAGTEAVLRLLARLDRHGELDLFLLGEQRLSGRSLEVEAQVVSVVGPKGTRRLRHFVSRSSPGPLPAPPRSHPGSRCPTERPRRQTGLDVHPGRSVHGRGLPFSVKPGPCGGFVEGNPAPHGLPTLAVGSVPATLNAKRVPDASSPTARDDPRSRSRHAEVGALAGTDRPRLHARRASISSARSETAASRLRPPRRGRRSPPSLVP